MTPSPKYAKTGGKLQEINPKPPQALPEAGLGVILHIFLVASLMLLHILDLAEDIPGN